MTKLFGCSFVVFLLWINPAFARVPAFFLENELFQPVASQVAVGAVANKGNLFGVMDDLGNVGTLQSVGLAMASGGATFGIGSGLDVAPKGLFSTAIQSGVSTVQGLITGDQSIEQALTQGAINAVATAGAASLANQIGELYHPTPDQSGGALTLRDPEISWTTHKFLHAGLGFGLGAVANINDPFKGGIGGVIGSVVAEMTSEATLPFWRAGAGDSLQYQTALRRAGNTGKLGGALLAFATGQDVNAASLAAVNAIENNSMLTPTPYWWAEQQIQENDQAAREGISKAAGDVYDWQAIEIEPLVNIHQKMTAPFRTVAAWADQRAQDQSRFSVERLAYSTLASKSHTHAEMVNALIPTTRGGAIITGASFIPVGSILRSATIVRGFNPLRIATYSARAPALQMQLANAELAGARSIGAEAKTLEVVASIRAEKVTPYEVGSYNSLIKRSKADGLEIHHAPQKHPAYQVIESYNEGQAPSIALPIREHRKIPNLSGDYPGNPRLLLARDAKNLRNYTNAPNSSIQELINMAKRLYPDL